MSAPALATHCPYCALQCGMHVRPDGIVSVRATVPANPPSAAMVIVDAAEEPTLTTVVVGLAEILKSGTLTVTVTEWDIVTPDPVTVTE